VVRIAFIPGRFPVLSETFVLAQLRGLRERGHDIWVHAEEPDPGEPLHAGARERWVVEQTRYRPRLPANWFARAVKGLGLLARGGPLRLLPALDVLRHGRLAASGRLLYAAAPLAGEGPFDVAHAHFGPNGSLAVALRSAGFLDCPVVTSFHGYDANVLPHTLGARTYDRLFSEGELFTVGSDFMRERLVSLGAPEGRVRRHPAGVDTARLPFSERRPGDSGEIRLLTVGRLVEVKGVEHGLRAIAELAGELPNLRYEVVGDGPLRGELEALAGELGIAERVEFTGGATHEEVLESYARAHLFLLPSVRGSDGAEEGQGLALLEAQATGLPVVASRSGGIPEGLRDGESGFLVPEGDPAAIAERVFHLARHPETWPAMGRAGRAHVEEGYDLAVLTDRLVAIYEELAG